MFLAYASFRGQALIDRRLCLPEHTGSQDLDRRSGSGIPEKIEFATRPRPAWQEIEAVLDAGCPSSWVAGDEVSSQDPPLRSAREARGIGYVLAVARTSKVRINKNRAVVQPATVSASLPRDTGHRQSAGAGAKPAGRSSS
ncbi:transposase [Streptomyces sp. NPDC086777]|uniref:transposase n=1 Tax=Streptomyces sp. NPDC086777 TaxID=3154866 RepID=UPI00344E5DA7